MVNFGINRKIESTKRGLVIKPVPPEPKPLFEQQKKHHRRALTRESIGSSHRLAGVRDMHRRERKEFVDKILPRKYGDYISETKVKQRLRELRREKFLAKTSLEKRELNRGIRYLERLTGVKKY